MDGMLPTLDYDLLINGISLVTLLIFTVFTARKFGLQHEGVMILLMLVVASGFIFGQEFWPAAVDRVALAIGTVATATVGFSGLKNTVFKKGQQDGTSGTPTPK